MQESVEKKFIKKLKSRMEKLRVGNPLDKSIDIGAIVAPIQLKKIKQIVEKGKKEGSKNYGNLNALVLKMAYFFPQVCLQMYLQHLI